MRSRGRWVVVEAHVYEILQEDIWLFRSLFLRQPSLGCGTGRVGVGVGVLCCVVLCARRGAREDGMKRKGEREVSGYY